jgi:adsorption protein B
MELIEPAMTLALGARNELLLFAGVGLLLGGLDDLLLDLIFGLRWLWRRLTVYRRHARMTADRLGPSARPGTLAVFIPAWDEGAVIGAMLRHTLTQWKGEDVQLFVGVYPNDAQTIAAVSGAARDDARVTLVVNARPGPTTKADCLNAIWDALLRWEAARDEEATAIVLYDAEDVVHADGPRVLSAMIDRFALVQLPVLPIVTKGSHWVAGHYCDEFAESHAKAMMVREALGAALPSAGVGCAIRRSAIATLADARHGRPFDPDSLTEDYEMGLRVGELGGRGIILRMRDAKGALIATREYFPDSIRKAVHQKARWTVGIALSGWDRLGWGGSWVEAWMRLRDRRALMAAVVLLAAYAGLVLTALVWGAEGVGLIHPPPLSWPMQALLTVNAILLFWRLLMRALFVHHAYGPVEALRAVPRVVIANIIAVMAARRAFVMYLAIWRGAAPQWDKTAHRFPDLAADGQA